METFEQKITTLLDQRFERFAQKIDEIKHELQQIEDMVDDVKHMKMCTEMRLKTLHNIYSNVVPQV